MKSTFRHVMGLSLITATLGLAACANAPGTPSDATYDRERPMTGSNIGHHTGNTQGTGADASGVTVYSPTSLPGAPGGNGLPGVR